MIIYIIIRFKINSRITLKFDTVIFLIDKVY